MSSKVQEVIQYVQVGLQLAGFLFNILFFCFTLKSKVGTRVSTVIMRSQAVIDAVILFMDSVVHKLIKNPAQLPVVIPKLALHLYCLLIYTALIYWCFVSMSVYNLVAQSIERFLCLCHPFWYRQNQTRVLRILLLLIIISPFLVEFPYCIIIYGVMGVKQSENDTEIIQSCYTHEYYSMTLPRQTLTGFGIAWVSLFWILPVILILGLYARIFFVLYSSQDKAVQAAKRLTIMLAIVSFSFVGFFAMDSIFYLMFNLGIIVKKLTFLEIIDSFLVSMNSVVNPFVYFIFFPKFRNFIVKCGRVEEDGKNSQASVSGTAM